MSVKFPVFPPKSVEPEKPPSKFIWVPIFLALTLAGIAATVFSWPNRQSTHTVWFWVWIVIYPVLSATFIVSRCFSFYEGRRLDAQAWNSARKRYIEHAFDLASVPMSVLEATFVAIEDENNALTALLNGELALKAQSSIADAGTITARWLKPNELEHETWERGPDTNRQKDVLKWVLRRLLDRTSPVISQIPSEVPLRVNLQVFADALRVDVSTVWSEIWAERKLRPAPINIECAPLSSVESWLDSNDFALKRSAILLVSVNLNKILSENPPQNSAEAGVMLLVAHQNAVAKCIKPPIALLHRPSRGRHPDTLARAVRYALRWGKTQASSIGNLWLTGIGEATSVTVHHALSQVGVRADRSGPLPEIDVERVVGHAGVAAPWLSVALAIEMIKKTALPQLVMLQDDGIFSMVVVAPPPSDDVKQHQTKNEPKIQD